MIGQNRPQPDAFIPTSALRGPEGSAYHRIAPSTQQTANPEPSTDIEDPHPAGEALQGAEASPSPALNAGPFCPQAWEVAYSRCPVLNNPYASAKEQSGAVIHLYFDNCTSAFYFWHHYLHICLNDLWRICVPTLPEFLSHVLYRHHGHVTAGYRGQTKTFQALSRHFYWPGMTAYTIAYVESCVQWRVSNSLNQNSGGILQPLLIPSRRWSHVSLDFVTDLPLTARDNDAILVLVDTLSKKAHFIPATKTVTAEATGTWNFSDRLTRYHGFPQVLISDRDPRFQSGLWRQLCHRFNIKRAMSSAHHPQSDGQTERTIKTLEQILMTYIQTDGSEWERLLPALELAYNCTSHSSTELSPFKVTICQNPITAADIDMVGDLAPTITPRMTKLFRHVCGRAQSHILRSKWQQKVYADKRRDAEFHVGDKVWINGRNLPGFARCSKFEPRYHGPFKITDRIGKVAYRVALPPAYTCHNVFHVSLLVKDRPRDSSMNSLEAAVGWLPVRDQAGLPTDTYEVGYIMAQHGTGDSAQYLVKWRGAPEDGATWEPESNLTGCKAFLRA